MIPQIIAGFYCDETKLAENAAFNQKLLVILVIVLAVFAPIAVFLIWSLKGRSKTAKVLTLLGISLVLIAVVVGFWIYGFANTPHWCGNS